MTNVDNDNPAHGGKLWYQSRTVIVNVVTVVAFLAAALAYLATDPGSGELFRPEVLTIFGVLAGLLNILLRFLTNEPIMIKRSDDAAPPSDGD